MAIDLSVIICTWNNSARLRKTLEALCACTIPPGIAWELIVVLNKCTDDSERVVQAMNGRLPMVVIQEPRQGLSKARNAGLAAARGDLVIFTDDDVTPEPDWIAVYWNSYQESPEGRFWGGPIESQFEGKTPPAELLVLATPSVRGLHWGREARPLGPQEYFISANWACPTHWLRQLGGFDENLGLNPEAKRDRVGEETELMNTLRARGLVPFYLPEAKIRHFVPSDKCSLKRIGDRAEAYEAYRAMGESPSDTPRFFGVPRWLYRVAAMAWIRWASAKLLGKPAYREYLYLRGILGRIYGYRETARKKRRGTE